MEGLLHMYQAKPALNIFEYTPRPAPATSDYMRVSPPNVLLFVGGLYDNFSGAEYLADLARLFPRHQSQQWALMHVQLSSAICCFGTSDLDQDVLDLGLAVTYIRSTIRGGRPTNIVLLGQSTGCQDVLHYICSVPLCEALRPQVQGVILQAPLSDRDCLITRKVKPDPDRREEYDRSLSLIATVPEDRHKAYMLPLDWTTPLFGKAPLCISRFLDLASPTSPAHPRKEDLFSTDLTPDRHDATWGKIGLNDVLTTTRSMSDRDYKSVLVLISELDTDILQPLTPEDMLGRWARALSSDVEHPVRLHAQSGMVRKATHDISGHSLGQQRARLVDFREVVLAYIDDMVRGVDEFAWDEWQKGLQWIERLEKQGV